MKERGIVFAAWEVLALLEGRKTQARAICKLGDHARAELVSVRQAGSDQRGWRSEAVFRDWRKDDPIVARCPYGAPGSKLWVKEAAIIAPRDWTDDRSTRAGQHVVDNDGRPRLIQYLATAPERDAADDYRLKATAARCMPRWASRITLELAAVRVERLQAISEADARAEGAPMFVVGHGPISADDLKAEPGYWSPSLYRNGYEDLWESLHGAESWAASPWVWVLELRVRP
jgi:hypothetical protein